MTQVNKDRVANQKLMNFLFTRGENFFNEIVMNRDVK